MNANIDVSNVTLKTERLILRPWNIDDLNDFNEYASVDGVGQDGCRTRTLRNHGKSSICL